MKYVLMTIMTACLILVATFMIIMFFIQSTAYDDVSYTIEQKQQLQSYHDENIEKLPELSKREWKAKVNKTIGYSMYIETNSKFMLNGYAGRSFGFLLTVAIDKNFTGTKYAAVLLHELVHTVFWYTDESMTEFTTFKLAYESSDPYVKQVANYTMGRSLILPHDDEYNATGRIVQYLEKSGVI